MSLYDEVRSHVADPDIVAVVMEEVLESTKGPNAVICPPTYSGGEKGRPHFATSDGPVPRRDAMGWYRDVERTGDEVRKAGRVVVNSLAACADRAETAIYRRQRELGVTLPAFVVRGGLTNDAVEAAIQRAQARKKSKGSVGKVAEDVREQVRKALDLKYSTWELAHRTADAWLQYAKDPASGRQIWADPTSSIKTILLSIAHEAGENVYAHAPNSAVYGAWLSGGTARRHAIPRAYSCEITGFGAVESVRATTKLDRMGGAPNSLKLVAGAEGVALADRGKKPSELGFGQVPSDPAPRGFTCETILSQASISLRAFERFRYAVAEASAEGSTDLASERQRAATCVYTLLAMAGHLLAQQDGFLRSECDLVTIDQHWGWRQHGNPEPLTLDVPTLPDVAEALKHAVQAAAEVGLTFHEPITVDISDAQVDLVVERVLLQSQQIVGEVGED